MFTPRGHLLAGSYDEAREGGGGGGEGRLA